MAERHGAPVRPDWVLVEQVVSSAVGTRAVWIGARDVRVRGRDLVVKMPPSPTSLAEAKARFAQTIESGNHPVVGIIGGTLGRAFVFLHAPAPRTLAAKPASRGVAVKVWPVKTRSHAWGHRKVCGACQAPQSFRICFPHWAFSPEKHESRWASGAVEQGDEADER
jgi:hypothetical protein